MVTGGGQFPTSATTTNHACGGRVKKYWQCPPPTVWETKKRSRFTGSLFDKYHIGNDEQGVHFHGRGRSKKYADFKVERTGGAWESKYGKNINHWDIAPGKEYFDELLRVCDRAIIWGGNYFSDKLPPSRNFIVWRKLTISEGFSMAMAEYAWTNIAGNSKVFDFAPQDTARFHPTQKPVALYKWLLQHYARPGDTILDTHLGSGSSRIAAYDAGYDFTGIELDSDYFEAQEKRFAEHTAQGELFEFSGGRIVDVPRELPL